MTGSDKNIFDRYYETASGLATGLSKTRAMELSRQPTFGMITTLSIRKLFQSLVCEGWKNKSAGSNWIWRFKKNGGTKSQEVLLERAVAARDVAMWACQMSTSSGVQGPYRHRRRAIDLVRVIGEHHYAFVEMKVGSDNPLYAAFEILGYAIAYLHSQNNDWKGAEKYDVFDAENIELTILGPEGWYKYEERGIDKRYKLDWLGEEITNALNEFVTAELKGKPTFTMKFREFPDNPLKTESDFVQTATEIDRRANCEWWKN
jgi:hypothetical protein